MWFHLIHSSDLIKAILQLSKCSLRVVGGTFSSSLSWGLAEMRFEITFLLIKCPLIPQQTPPPLTLNAMETGLTYSG